MIAVLFGKCARNQVFLLLAYLRSLPRTTIYVRSAIFFVPFIAKVRDTEQAKVIVCANPACTFFVTFEHMSTLGKELYHL